MRQLLPARGLLSSPARSDDRILRRSWLVPSMRGSLFVLVALLAAFDPQRLRLLPWVLALGAVAIAAQWRARNDLTTRLLILAEASIAALGGVLTGGADSPLLAYLPATTAAAGIAAGLDAALLTAGVMSLVLIAGRAHFHGGQDSTRYSAQAAQAAALSLMTGVLGGLLRSRLRDRASADTDRFAEAYRLLEQLRNVTRGLPGSLDPGAVASNVISECRAMVDFTRAGVFLQTGGSILVPLALEGVRRVPWRIDLEEPGPVATAWNTGSPVQERRSADTAGRRRGSHLLILPITVNHHAIGVVALESLGEQQVSDEVIEELWQTVEASSLPLETAVLFDELRSSAALEERERLAKEMHDGIAQELAYVGFELDALLSEMRKGDLDRPTEHAGELRRRITGLISDLRLSMSDLRSSTGPTRGLGAALSEYARSVGTSSTITVHLSLAEGAIRLPGNTEQELLRIAHEAIAGARRRPNVKNLWVTLTVEPPAASMTIEDDGEDEPSHARSEDVRVIRERAERIRARIEIAPRLPQGASVRVDVGGGTDADSLAG